MNRIIPAFQSILFVAFSLPFHPEILEHYLLVLSVGDDEYWSTPMRDNLEAWIAKGGNAAFFSGNSVCWQVRTEDEGKSFTCFKQNYHLDPVFQTRDFKCRREIRNNS